VGKAIVFCAGLHVGRVANLRPIANRPFPAPTQTTKADRLRHQRAWGSSIGQ
jgi:hypothetical protein